MDLERVLAKFTARGPIESRGDLDNALEELLDALEMSREEIPFLLDVLASGPQGLLEAVLTSSGRTASAFRSRVIKTFRKSLATSLPDFKTCADKLGAFLITIPPNVIQLDRRVMEAYSAYTSATVELEPMDYQHTTRTPSSPTSPTTPSKREWRHSRSDSSSVRSSGLTLQTSTSGRPETDIPKLLKAFLEHFFSMCINKDVEQLAVNTLLSTLTPEDSGAPAKISANRTTFPSNTSPLKPSNLEQLHYLSIKEENIVKYLNHASKPKSGNWPVVVSQRGIKRMRGFVAENKEVFLRIEKKIRCTDEEETRIRFKGITTTPPKLSSPLDTSQWNKEGADIEVDKTHFLELHRFLALEKFIPLSRNFFDGKFSSRPRSSTVSVVPNSQYAAIQKFDEDSFIFAVSSSESRIITHPSSCLVLGRSGTGKTTCMLFRMAVLDMDANDMERKARQMFVTQSGTLATKVRQYWTKLTQQEQNEANQSSAPPMAGLTLADIDEDAEEDGLLPSKFSELTDSHFPVFLTYKKLCQMLEADYGLQFNPSMNTASLRTLRNAPPQGSVRQPLIDFKYFETQIWPHLDQSAKKGFHPILVYSEIMGVIKGSEASRSYPKLFLDRQGYESQSSRGYFGNATERSRLYTLFEGYLKVRPLASYDAADRVHMLLNEVERRGVPGNPVDFLYVDEAQDHLIMDAALLRSVCPNPDGLFFAGDTAQTISAGSTFRFTELKAFLFRLEKENELVKRGYRKLVNPQFFQLSTNYRSHSGIVKSAAFLVQLLISYFGHCIDALTPEASLVDISSHKPSFFLGRANPADFLRLISNRATGEPELGADQEQEVIIVRDEESMHKLQDLVGKVNILTLYNSKGMEYDDVILYDFFDDSLATATDWRAIVHAQSLGQYFDEQRHAILRTELKSLYVGLTRARERVWIWDRSKKGSDLESLLVSLSLATIYDELEPVPQLGVSSSAHKWSQRAQQYFSKGLFTEAALAFDKAGMDWWARVAVAYGDRQTAMRFSQSSIAAAREFERLARSPEGAENPATARQLYINAAECYASIPDHVPAANAFLKCQRYTDAAQHFRAASSYEDAVKVIKRHIVDPEVSESITAAAKIVFTKRGDTRSLRKACDLFEDKEKYLEYLEDHDFKEQRITFLESLEEYEKAGDILRGARNYTSAIIQFRRANTTSSRQKATACLLAGLRSHICFAKGYGPKSEEGQKSSEQLSRLFELSRDVELSQDEADEVSAPIRSNGKAKKLSQVEILRAVSELDLQRLKELGVRSFDAGDAIHALLAFDAWANSNPIKNFSFESASEVDAAEVLTTCLHLTSAVNKVIATRKLLDQAKAREIFGISFVQNFGAQSASLEVLIKSTSFIYDSLKGPSAHRSRKRTSTKRSSKRDSETYSRTRVEDEISRSLLARLSETINNIESLAQVSQIYELSVPFTSDEQPRLTVSKLGKRLELHILTILLLGKPEHERLDTDKLFRGAKQRWWLDRLFRLCYPRSNAAGNVLSRILSEKREDRKVEDPSSPAPPVFDRHRQTLQNVNDCITSLYGGLSSGDSVREFLSITLKTAMLFTAFDSSFTISKAMRAYGPINSSTKRHLTYEAWGFFATQNPNRTGDGMALLEIIAGGNAWLDINVAIAFTEEVCGQLIFNQETHREGGRSCLTLPRSWIPRVFSRGGSTKPNNSEPARLVSLLGRLLDTLVSRENRGHYKLHFNGIPLSDPQLCMYLEEEIIRLSRCLILVGHNIPHLRASVLSIFNEMAYLSLDWHEVVDDLKTCSSSADELICITWKEDPPSNEHGLRTMLCSDEQDLLRELSNMPEVMLTDLLTSDISAPGPEAAQQASTFEPVAPLLEVDAKQSQDTAADGAILPSDFGESATVDLLFQENLSLGDADQTEKPRKSVKTIEGFWIRRQAGAGDPLRRGFAEVVKRRSDATGSDQASRHLRLCLRGPLPHAVEFLEKFHDIVQGEVSAVNKQVISMGNDNLDEINRKAKELRRIRNEAKKLIKNLEPESQFYFGVKSKSPASISDIIKSIKGVQDLILSLRSLSETILENDEDYVLGVEPILSSRAPWA
ncbi:hypothetical protein FRB90_012598 [Tulasnella sp. 427]|nr:hypothetical protein FRB90_012598 [Tulasnella sp. 427]